jgi:hypothetical protein
MPSLANSTAAVIVLQILMAALPLTAILLLEGSQGVTSERGTRVSRPTDPTAQDVQVRQRPGA